MDVFASTIRRTPTAISWSQMEVLLPAPDANWYQDNPAGSCFLEQEPGQRWKALQESGNVSPKAWFIVINSLMKDAQVISCPRDQARAGSRLQRVKEGKASLTRLRTAKSLGRSWRLWLTRYTVLSACCPRIFATDNNIFPSVLVCQVRLSHLDSFTAPSTISTS
ncbi:hypothetical protein LB505_009848 [Fusarium chuoi]|nr:hypothetical protein LB505_009848 [Fusarium chuoi]